LVAPCRWGCRMSLLVIDLSDGLPPVHATIGNAVMTREPEESVEDFRARAREVAIELGAKIVVLSCAVPELFFEEDAPDVGPTKEGSRP
jgi:hypothetical protein